GFEIFEHRELLSLESFEKDEIDRVRHFRIEIETSLAGLPIRCKTQYQQAGYVNYMISCVNQNAVDSNIVQEYLLEQQYKKINNQMKQCLPIVLFNINQILEFEENITENVAEIDPGWINL
ncbi:46254_t:CDS:2, partial [Gigaspora margarita]